MQRLAPSLMPATRYVSNMIGRILPSPRTSSNAFQSQLLHLSRKFTINSLEILFKGVGSTLDREEHQLARRETHPLESTASLLWHKQHCPGRHSLYNIYFFCSFLVFFIMLRPPHSLQPLFGSVTLAEQALSLALTSQ